MLNRSDALSCTGARVMKYPSSSSSNRRWFVPEAAGRMKKASSEVICGWLLRIHG